MPDRAAVILGSGFDELFQGHGTAAAAANDYGLPSSALYAVDFGGRPALALARHGIPHALPPHRINYRANLKALELANVTAIVALNTVGGVTSVVASGGLAVPDQIIDYTWGREHTFADQLGEGAEHIDFTQPFAAALRRNLLEAAEAAGVDCFDGGVYAATQGPRLETAAEVDRLERDGADYVGMTGMPEAALARELGLDYACLALVVNQAAGRGEQPIHAELEATSAVARGKAIAVVERFLDVHGARP